MKIKLSPLSKLYVVFIMLFMYAPIFVMIFFSFNSSVSTSVFEGFMRMLIFLGYMVLVSQMRDIKRVYEYHGAEHKTIACYEAGEELTVENVRKHKRFHPRCGTSFLLFTMIISIIVYAFLPRFDEYIKIVAVL